MTMRVILAAMLLVVGASAASAATVNVVDYGAIPDDGLDDRAAFDAAISAALKDGPGIVDVPCGVFDVTRTPGAGSIALGAINLFERHGLTIRGAGRCSVVRNLFAGPISSGHFYTFNLQDSSTIRFEDLALDGNRGAVTSANEQIHLVRTFDSSHLAFDRVTFVNSFGDAIKLISTGRVLVRDCHVDNMGRNGITFHNDVTDVVVTNTVFQNISDQAIDFEAGSFGPRRVILDKIRVYDSTLGFDGGKRFALALSGGGIIPQGVTKRIRLTNSYIEGPIDMVRAGDTQIHGNTIISRIGCLRASRFLRDISIIGNQLYCNVDNRGSGAPGGAALSFVQVGNQIDGPANLIISRNLISLGDSDTAQAAIEVVGGRGRNIVTGNVFVSQQSGAAGVPAVSVKSVTAGQVTRGLAVLDNVIQGFSAGLRLAAARGAIEDAMFVQNTVIDTGIVGVGVLCSGSVSPSVMIGPNLLGAGAPFTGSCATLPFAAP